MTSLLDDLQSVIHFEWHEIDFISDSANKNFELKNGIKFDMKKIYKIEWTSPRCNFQVILFDEQNNSF